MWQNIFFSKQKFVLWSEQLQVNWINWMKCYKYTFQRNFFLLIFGPSNIFGFSDFVPDFRIFRKNRKKHKKNGSNQGFYKLILVIKSVFFENTDSNVLLFLVLIWYHTYMLISNATYVCDFFRVFRFFGFENGQIFRFSAEKIKSENLEGIIKSTAVYSLKLPLPHFRRDNHWIIDVKKLF